MPDEAAISRRSALAATRRRRPGGHLAPRLGGLGCPLGGGGAATDEAYAASCVLTPELTEGPYYLDLRKIRGNITERKAGLRLDLRIRVVNASTCKPIANVAVDVWHCDALGKYSGISSEGTSGKTYLRGIQLTNSSGLARIRTIYPGWYRTRATPHPRHGLCRRPRRLHLLRRHRAHTGQLFFRDATTDRVASCRRTRGAGSPACVTAPTTSTARAAAARSSSSTARIGAAQRLHGHDHDRHRPLLTRPAPS